MTQPGLNEFDVLFELLLPVWLEEYEANMRSFSGEVRIVASSEPPRMWRLRGGPRPWIERDHDRSAVVDATIIVAPEVVREIVGAGAVFEVETALKSGMIQIQGDLEVLERLVLLLATSGSTPGGGLPRTNFP